MLVSHVVAIGIALSVHEFLNTQNLKWRRVICSSVNCFATKRDDTSCERHHCLLILDDQIPQPYHKDGSVHHCLLKIVHKMLGYHLIASRIDLSIYLSIYVSLVVFLYLGAPYVEKISELASWTIASKYDSHWV